MNNVTWLEWSDIETLCSDLAEKIKNDGFLPDVIVGIQRGGCIPAVLLSHHLGIEAFYTLGIRTTSSNDIRAVRQEPLIVGKMVLEEVRGKKVLLVDDVTNTGKTLEVAINEIASFEPISCKTAVIIWDGDGNAACSADYYSKFTPGWVVFPWEKVHFNKHAHDRK